MEPVLGEFQVVRVLGKGGMGSVYEVRLPDDPRRLALKKIHVTNERTVERFRREGEMVARLDHPNIVAVRGAGLLPDESPYLLFDLVEGKTVHDELCDRNWLSESRTLEIAKQVASALAHAHERGVVHRDLKPANLLISEDDGRVLLADFGLAVAEDMERMTRTGQMVGTPLYFAPEQIHGQDRIGPATDIHAVGVLLYELLTGTPPFVGSGHSSLFEAILKRQPSTVRTERPEVTRDLSDLISRCLKKDPSARYADGAELLAALEQVGRSGGRRRLFLGGLLALSAVAVAAAVALSPTPDAREPGQTETRVATKTTAGPEATSPAEAKPTERFLPRWQPPVGSKDVYTLSWHNRNAAADYKLTWRATYEAEASEPKRVVIKVTIDHLKGSLTSSMVRTQVDSAKPVPGAHGMEPLAKMVGRSFWIELDNVRARIRIRGAEEVLAPAAKITGSGLVSRASLPDFWNRRGLELIYSGYLVHLPPKPVAVGERWTRRVTCVAPEATVGINVRATISMVAELETLKDGRGRYRVWTIGDPEWKTTSRQLTPAMRRRFVTRTTAEWLSDRPLKVHLVGELGAEDDPADRSVSTFVRHTD